MSRIAYVSGHYVPHRDAAVHIEDRGYQFADGVYEVITVHKRRLVDAEGHMARLKRSLSELRIDWPMSPRALNVVMKEVIQRNRVRDGLVYIQITRGVAPRDHAFPKNAESVLVLTSRRTPPFDIERARKGVDVITLHDIRWKRRDIKSISLLPNVLGKQEAREKGAYEAWLVDDDGTVTEGTSSNAWIVSSEGQLITRQADEDILSGITRLAIMKLAEEEGIILVQRPFTVAEAKSAREAFVTSSTSFVKPVIRIDGEQIGTGKTGPVVDKLLTFYGNYLDTQEPMG